MFTTKSRLPQLSGDIFIVDAGLETDLIFNHGIDIPEFAAHTLLCRSDTRKLLESYFTEYLQLAAENNIGIILDAPTWKAHDHWKGDLGCSSEELERANRDAVLLVQELREKADPSTRIVLNGITGPCGDAYSAEDMITVKAAEQYHRKQIGWLAKAQVDMVTALTFTQSTEAAGYARAAANQEVPCVISFTLETDGRLPGGQLLKDAICFVDDESDDYPAYYMINCAHPDHFSHIFDGETWTRRLRGLRCNASRQSHAELDACEVLDDGDPVEFGEQYRELTEKLPWLNVFGGCCGSDIRHLREIVKAIVI